MFLWRKCQEAFPANLEIRKLGLISVRDARKMHKQWVWSAGLFREQTKSLFSDVGLSSHPQSPGKVSRREISAESRKQECKCILLRKNLIVCKKAVGIRVTGNREKGFPERWRWPGRWVTTPGCTIPAVHAGPWGWFVPTIEQAVNSRHSHSQLTKHDSTSIQSLPHRHISHPKLVTRSLGLYISLYGFG